MVVHSEVIDRIFRALADPTRRDVMLRVMKEEQSVSELASRYAMSFAAVQKHVAVLEKAGLVDKRRVGREARVRGNVQALRHATDLLGAMEQIWVERVNQMGELVAALNEQGDEP